MVSGTVPVEDAAQLKPSASLHCRHQQCKDVLGQSEPHLKEIRDKCIAGKFATYCISTWATVRFASLCEEQYSIRPCRCRQPNAQHDIPRLEHTS